MRRILHADLMRILTRMREEVAAQAGPPRAQTGFLFTTAYDADLLLELVWELCYEDGAEHELG